MLPDRRHDDQGQVWLEFKQMIPVDAERTQPERDDAHWRGEHEYPEDAGHDRGHGIGPDQQRLVDALAAHDAIRHDRQQQRKGQTTDRHQNGKDRGVV